MTNDTIIASLADAGVSMPVPPSAMDAEKLYSENEEGLAQRYRKSKRAYQDLTFEFSRDPVFLHQYRLIYEREFRLVQNAINYKSVADEHDRNSHFLIVRQRNLCVGGARLTIKSPRKPQPLPIEMNNFCLEDHFPHLGHKELTYGQVGRICLLPEFREGLTIRMIFWHIHRKAMALGASELFGTATLPSVRSYRQNCRAIGLEKATIHRDIELPLYPMCEDIRFYLIRIPLDRIPLEQESNVIPPMHTQRTEELS